MIYIIDQKIFLFLFYLNYIILNQPIFNLYMYLVLRINYPNNPLKDELVLNNHLLVFYY